MIDLADLDRRAISVMGWTQCASPAHRARCWMPAGESCNGDDGSCYIFPPRPTRRADDCREFEQWALESHEDWMLDVVTDKDLATTTVHTSGGWAFAETDRAEHGPSYDLVARVLALLDALEGEAE